MTSSLLASDGAGTVSTTRVTESDSDQLMNCSVINALFGTMISFRSQSLIVVARVLISHCSFDHSIPIIEKPTSPPNSMIRYLVMVVIA